MPRATYPLEYRQRLVELVCARQSPEDLAREYKPGAVTIREWVERADAIECGRGGLTRRPRTVASASSSDSSRLSGKRRRTYKRPRPVFQAGAARESGSDSV